jgi:hypothetical protein
MTCPDRADVNVPADTGITWDTTWDLSNVYRALGVTGKTLPREMRATVEYAGLLVTVHPTASKPNDLYRVYVLCSCGKTIPFGKMRQHMATARVHGARRALVCVACDETHRPGDPPCPVMGPFGRYVPARMRWRNV